MMELKKDKIIKSTDLDALSCRYFANKYLQDPLIDIMCDGVKRYLPYSSPITLSIQRNLKSYFNHPKTPIINRGTYIRTKSIDLIVDQFLRQFPEQCQILSIGAGSDTRFLNFLQRYQHLKVYEYDFEDSVKVKKCTIVNNEKLRNIIGYTGDSISITSYDEFHQLDSSLQTDCYSISPIDLRELTAESFSELDPKIPTLILSECVLCYMSIEESYKVLNTITAKFQRGVFLIYEPIGGDGNFGQVMTRNLSARGIELPSLMEFNNLDKQMMRFTKVDNVEAVHLSDLNFIFNNWIDDVELQRINKLEFLDELEELNLINKHYCLCLLQWGGNFTINQIFQINKLVNK